MSKVKFNIKNIHVAVQTNTTPGAIAFDTPFAIPGAVGLSLEPKGEMSVFYADGVEYYTTNPNLGYEGEAEVALVTDEFRQKILKETLDSKNVLMEMADVEPVHFAFGFQIDGDEKEQLFWFYDCTATRPTTASKTNEENKEPQTDSIKIKVIPALLSGIDKRIVRSKTAEEATDVRGTWFETVYVPSPSPAVLKSK